MASLAERFRAHVDPEEITAFVCDLIRQNTVNPPGNEYLCKDLVSARLEALGMRLDYFEKAPGRTNVVGVRGAGAPTVAIIGHMDVVPPGDGWLTDPFDPVVREGRIYGRGALDDKGSFVAGYAAVKAFLAEFPNFPGTIYLIAAADEEQGSPLGIIYLMEEEGLRFDYGIIPDGGYMNMAVVGEKGILRLYVRSHGRKAHGSVPEEGVNAIVKLARAVGRLAQLDLSGLPCDRLFTPATLSVGTIRGGIAENVVPDLAEMALDIRYPAPATADQIQAAVQAELDRLMAEDPESRFELVRGYTSLPHVNERTARVIQEFKRAADDLHMEMDFRGESGQTVAKDMFFRGTASIVHYPGDRRVIHRENENVAIADLVEGAVLYAVTLARVVGLAKD
jgi:succinyl-diaminopimelate desuccinylase